MTHSFKRKASVLVAAATLFLLVPTIDAQTVTGGIRGVITDTSGAALPDAIIVARNTATGVEVRTTTTGEGLYAIPRIIPGRYNLTVEVKAFKKAEVTDIEVTIGKDSVIDLKLEPGAITEVVTVTGGAEALVEKDSVQISATFQERKVQELPVSAPGGGLDRLGLLVPGVIPGFGNVMSNGTTLSVNGNRARSNNFTIDGVDNNDLSIGGPSYQVRNPDVVSEYQIVTNNFSAEYGRNQGAVLNVVSRSGGNQFHGRGTWEHLDNANFNSLTNIEKRQGLKEPVQNLTNIFGYSVGGPVIKNKIFFFTSGFFQRNPGSTILRTTSVAPTPAGIQTLKSTFPNNAAIQYYADFSAFSLPIGNPTPRTDVAQTSIALTAPNGSQVTIPMAAVQRIVSRNTKLDEYTARGDANLGDKHRIFGRYLRQKFPNADGGAAVSGFTYDFPQFARQVGGAWTYTITPQLVNEFRANYSLLFFIFGGGGTGGKGNIPTPDQIDTALTNVSFQFTAANGANILGFGPATNLPQGRTVESYQFNDNLTWTRGSHTMKMGFDFRFLDNAVPFLPNVNGAFVFANAQQFSTNNAQQLTVALGPANLVYNEKDKFAYFQDDWRIKPNLTLNLGVRYENTGQPINLLNDITTKREADPQKAFWRQNVAAAGKTVPRIPTDANNWAPRVGFVYSPNYSSGLLGRLLGENKTTVRGGYGIAYDASFYNLLLNISTAAPTVFLTSVAGVGVPSATPTGDKVRAAAQASGFLRFNTFDPGFLTRTTVNTKFRSPYSQQWSLGIQREIYGNNVFEVRYVATRGVGQFQTINANPFIGNLVNGFPRNYFDPATSTTRTLNFPGFPNTLPSGTRPQVCTDNPQTPDREDACSGRLLPFGVARERINGAFSSYHGLQMRYESRFRKQLNFGLTYTWSHAIDNASEVFNFANGNTVAVAQNPLNITGAEKGNSGFDARHVFTANFLWDIPLFKEQKGILGRALGGWQFNGIVRVQSGQHFTPTHLSPASSPYGDATFMNSFFGISQLRPFSGNPNAPNTSVAITDVDACLFFTTRCNAGVAGIPAGLSALRPSSSGYYLLSDLNRGVFTPVTPNDVRFIVNGPGAATRFGSPFGNIGRNTFNGDRTENVDLSIFKTFRITEQVKFQYRLQMFNAFNHPNFGIPNTLNVETAGTTFFNFRENDGGRRTISMGLGIIF
jgi:outer membrane receptor protein involved in Fe transport